MTDHTRRPYDVHVAGRTSVTGPSGALPLRPKELAVLAALVFDRPAAVGTARLAELVWGPSVPPSSRKSLQNHVARIRRVAPDLVETTVDGYRLGSGVRVDVDLLIDRTGTAPRHPTSQRAIAQVVQHLAGGEAYADLAALEEVDECRRELMVARMAAEHRLAELDLDAGRPDRAVVRGRRLVVEDPYREQSWVTLARALAVTGDVRSALATLQSARASLAEVGLVLGPAAIDLERRLLIDEAPVDESPGPALEGVFLDPGAQVDVLLDGDRGPAHLVTGPAGAGKTTLVGEAARRARQRGDLVFRAACTPDAVAPLEPVVDLVEQIRRELPETLRGVDGAEALGVLSPALAGTVGRPAGSVDRRRLLEVLGEVVDALPEGATLVVEDVHWAPPRTLEALVVLAERAVGGSVAHRVWFTARTEPGRPRPDLPAVATNVEPWSVTSVERWLEPIEPDPARRRAGASWLHRQSGGGALFVRELTLDLVRRGHLGERAEGPFEAPGAVPPAVVAALATRVDRLGPVAREALDTAVVLGAEIRLDDLRAVLGTDAGIGELLAQGMLRPVPTQDDTVAVEHDLLRRVVLDAMSVAARAERHDVAHTALKGSASPVELARHALAAASLDRHRAMEAAVEAGLDALGQSARSDAAEWWLTACELLETSGPEADRRVQLLADAGQQLLHAGDDRARDVLHDAALEAERRGRWAVAARAASALARLGPTSEAGEADREVAALCDRLLARVMEPGPRAVLAAATTVVHSLTGEAELCRALFTRAEADARLADDDEVWAEVLPYAYQSLSAPADLVRREEIADQLATVAEDLGRPDARWSALHLRFSNQVQRGDPGLRASAVALGELAPMVRELSRDWEMHYVRATVLQLDGDVEACEACITDSLDFAGRIASSRVSAVFGAQILSLRHQQGRLPELVDTLEGLIETQPGVAAWWAALGLAAARAGRVARARAALDTALGDDAALLDRDQTFSAALVALGEAAVALGDRAHLDTLLAHLEPLSGRWSWTGSCTLGPVDTTLAGLVALTGDLDRGCALGHAAVDAARRLGAPGFEASARDRLEELEVRRPR